MHRECPSQIHFIHVPCNNMPRVNAAGELRAVVEYRFDLCSCALEIKDVPFEVEEQEDSDAWKMIFPMLKTQAVATAASVKGRYGLTRDDIDDIEQELLVHMVGRVDDYEADKSMPGAFYAAVARNKLRDILSQRLTMKRDTRKVRSLDAPSRDSEHSLKDVISEADYFKAKGISTLSDASDCGEKVNLFVRQLPQQLQTLCVHLMTLNNISEISKLLGTPESTLRSRVQRIRQLAIKSELYKFI